MYTDRLFSLEDFKGTIPFTALGARTCYSPKGLDYLLNDPRVSSRQERANFLSKLGNLQHFSVFAHSFAYKDLAQIDEETIDSILGEDFKNLPKVKKAEILAQKVASLSFKSSYNLKYPTVVGVSLRHYLEDLLSVDKDRYIQAFEKMAEYDTPVNPVGTEGNTTLIGLITEYDGYAVFFIDNVSRTMTHQLVRHTTLNFSQRSQRYVKEDQNTVVIPPSVASSEVELNPETAKLLIDTMDNLLAEIKQSETKEDILAQIEERLNKLKKLPLEKGFKLKDLFDLSDRLTQFVYETAVYKGKVKREDARFILPHGRKTTIVVSGTLKWIKDFIHKRIDPHAQWEIQQVANQMRTLLQKQGVDV
ncbi:MAG: FAD-dependent thymidylate synthase [Aquificae bacterium]|nr:FAD-dependent thymidylate synthase [Aquificota bacterium]